MALTPDDIKSLVAAFDASDWGEMSVRIGDTTLELTRTGRPPEASAVRTAEPLAVPPVSSTVPAAAPGSLPQTDPVIAMTATTGVTDTALDGHLVCAPSPGIFWRSPEPGVPPFADVGLLPDRGHRHGLHRRGHEADEPRQGRHHNGTVVAVYGENGKSPWRRVSGCSRSTRTAAAPDGRPPAPGARRQPWRDRRAHRARLLRRGHRGGRHGVRRRSRVAGRPASPTASSASGRGAAESYLAINRVLPAALRPAATRVHPGYGFLSERAALRGCLRGARPHVRRPVRPTPSAAGGDKIAGARACRTAAFPPVPGCGAASPRRPRPSRRGHRLPGDAEGGGGRWRPGHGRSSTCRRPVEHASLRPAGGARRLRRRPALRRALRRPGPARRGADPGRPPRHHRPPRRARLLHAAAHQKLVEEAPAAGCPATCAAIREWRRSRSARRSTTRAPAPSSSSSTSPTR